MTPQYAPAPYAPETLRALGNPEWSPSGIELRKVRAMDLDAAADAWEACERRHEMDLELKRTLRDEMRALRTRLEAAEKKNRALTDAAQNTYCRNCDGANGCMDCRGRVVHDECEKNCPVCCGDDAEVVGLWELHALAGEK